MAAGEGHMPPGAGQGGRRQEVIFKNSKLSNKNKQF